MKVGDYVRTKKHGIGKIISFSYQEDDECCFIELSKRRTGIKQSNIIKSSPNIIDLIEVGDYVNGLKVQGVNNEIKGFGTIIFSKDSSIMEDYIYSTVTKEQFKNIEYEVK